MLNAMRYCVALIWMLLWPSLGLAESLVSEPKYVPSVEENLRIMDKDGNGLVTASEVRAYLQLKHGAAYEKAILDKMQSTESGASCGTPFAQSFY
jgi:hypothetical protein